MNIFKVFLFFLLLACPFFISFAATNEEVFSSFKQVFKFSPVSIKVPTVVEIPLLDGNFRDYFVVFDNNSLKFEPNIVIEKNSLPITPRKILVDGKEGNYSNLFDYSFGTSSDFNILSDEGSKISISYEFDKIVKSDHLLLSLDRYVSMPKTVTIKTKNEDGEKIVLSNFRPNSELIYFPESEAKTWTIDLEISQPLRVNELEVKTFNEGDAYRAIRFLAYPNHAYSVYLNPEIIVPVEVGEFPNLSDNRDVSIQLKADIKNNNLFKEADIDRDGVPDLLDNCVKYSNPQQEDINSNGRGDACDDFDRDGIINSIDNCVNVPNYGQMDSDSDGIGDTCDTEESRVTEKYPFLVWGVIILSVIVFLGLLFEVSRMKKGVKK